MNGVGCGTLVFLLEDFEDFRRGVNSAGFIKFIKEEETKP
jgi:hypothetical protein